MDLSKEKNLAQEKFSFKCEAGSKGQVKWLEQRVGDSPAAPFLLPLPATSPGLAFGILVSECRTPQQVPIQVSRVPVEAFPAAILPHGKGAIRVSLNDQLRVCVMPHAIVSHSHGAVGLAHHGAFAVAVKGNIAIMRALLIAGIVPLLD